MKKIILSAALTGAATNRQHCPHIPYTPVEIAEEAKRARDAGASIVHIHAREDNGMPSWRLEVFQRLSISKNRILLRSAQSFGRFFCVLLAFLLI